MTRKQFKKIASNSVHYLESYKFDGVCIALDMPCNYFSKIFRPAFKNGKYRPNGGIDGRPAYWLGNFTETNHEIRRTFLAMFIEVALAEKLYLQW